MTEIPSYSEFKQDTVIGGNLMSALVGLADKQQIAEIEVERIEGLLDEAKSNLKRIKEREIPQLMDGLQGKINLPDGRVVSVSEKVRANIKSDRKSSAIKWLEDNNQGAIIKRQFVIEFGKDQQDWAKKFEEELNNSDTPLNIKKEHRVHWQTMAAFAREQLENGGELPMDLFSIYRQRISNIK